jgi:hypothetical protein
MLSPRQQHLSIQYAHFTITPQQPITPVMRINLFVAPDHGMQEVPVAILAKQYHGVYVVVMHC